MQAFERTDFRGQFRQILWGELGLLSALIMEIAWLVPWIQVNIPGAQSTKTLPIFLQLALFALIVMWTSRRLNSNAFFEQFVLVVILVGASLWFLKLTIFSGIALGPIGIFTRTLSSFSQGGGRIPPALILILITLFVWWRGIVIGGKSILDYFGVRSRFRLGIAMLAIFGLLNSSANNRYLLDVIPLFFISGLLAIALSRTHRLGQSRAAFHLPFTEGWFLGIVILTLVTLAFGVLGGELLRTPLALEIAKIIGDLVIRSIQVVILVLTPFFIWIPALADKLNELLNTPDQVQPDPVNPDAEIGEPLFDFSGGEQAPVLEIPPAIVIFMVVLGISLLVALIVRSSRRRKKLRIPDFGDSGESVYQSQNLEARLRGWINQAKEGIVSAARFGLGKRMLAATAIRWTYSQLLDFAARTGRQRKPHETPIEFQEHLRKLFPLHAEEIALITGAYTKVRYGEFPEEEDIVALVRSAWVRMRS